MTLNDIFRKKDMHFILFGGKGGVGKTSCAAAAALWAAKNLEKKIIVISTDPAHSLGDSLGEVLTPGEVIKVSNIDNLWALEISPQKEQNEMIKALSTIPKEEMAFGADLTELSGLNPPGIDESLAFGKVLEFIDKSDFDLVIFDTAPTGHTLRLLSIPDMLSGWMGKMLSLKLKIGKIFGGFKGLFKKSNDDKTNDEDSLESIKDLKLTVERAKKILTNPEKTSFVICTIAEIMSIYETERLISSLAEYEIPTDHIVVNQLYPEHIDCKFCSMRREMQQKHLKEIEEIYAEDFDIVQIPLFDSEIRKMDALEKFSGSLFN